MSKKMKAKEMLFDFLDTLFLIFLISFCVFYFIVLDNFAVAQKIASMAIYFSVFGIIFIIKVKFLKIKMREMKTKDTFDDIAVYFDKHDKIKDCVAVFSLPIIIIALAALNKTVDMVDVLQSVFTLAAAYGWHWILFRKKEDVTLLMYATNFDMMKDQLVIFFLPLIVVGLAFLNKEVDLIDILQAVFVFLIMYFWHKILFKKDDLD